MDEDQDIAVSVALTGGAYVSGMRADEIVKLACHGKKIIERKDSELNAKINST